MSSPIRFHLDEHVPAAVAVGLRRKGIDVTAPHEVGLTGALDPDHLNFARAEGRVIVTHDPDFTRLHAQGVSHAGIAYCHQEKYTVGELIGVLVVVHGVLTAEEMIDTLEYL
jgi:hypothetical protein